VTTSHRSLILDAIKEGALELANVCSFESCWLTFLQRSLLQKQLQVNRDQREQVRKMEEGDYQPIYPQNTRRWGSKPKEESTAPNRFPKYAPLFFYSILRDYDNPYVRFTSFLSY
jgi:hypothetical protein